MELKSSAFPDDDSIPSKYTCDGRDVSPPLKVGSIPDTAESLALVVEDPDAPGGTFDHWLVWNLPAGTERIPEAVPTTEKIKDLGGAVQGKNDFGEIGYRGPCPPGGEHRYRFKLLALDEKLSLSAGSTKKELLSAAEESAVAEAELTGLYSR